jgi:hypothetical protein
MTEARDRDRDRDLDEPDEAALIDPPGWPVLRPLADWQDTCTTLHMWLQVVGKLRLALSPRDNHWWGSTLYVTSTGLTTSPIPYGRRTFTIDFDFHDHRLRVATSDSMQQDLPLGPMPVAEFYRRTMAALREFDIDVAIFTRPVEVVEAIRFEEDDRHASYDPPAAGDFWMALVQADRVFKRFRAEFLGKASPVHLFWGAFDLAVTRFSGRTAPRHPGGVPHCADWVMHEAYSHEVSSAGFWPGTGLGEAAFYSYAYPRPAGYAGHPVRPAAAGWHEGLGEFILPYVAVRTADDPDGALLDFLRSTYEAAADLGDWDRDALERRPVAV